MSLWIFLFFQSFLLQSNELPTGLRERSPEISLLSREREDNAMILHLKEKRVEALTPFFGGERERFFLRLHLYPETPSHLSLRLGFRSRSCRSEKVKDTCLNYELRDHHKILNFDFSQLEQKDKEGATLLITLVKEEEESREIQDTLMIYRDGETPLEITEGKSLFGLFGHRYIIKARQKLH